MVSFGEKAKIKKAGNLNQGRSYVITTVHKKRFEIPKWLFEATARPWSKSQVGISISCIF